MLCPKCKRSGTLSESFHLERYRPAGITDPETVGAYAVRNYTCRHCGNVRAHVSIPPHALTPAIQEAIALRPLW
jgi:hypothetical protein